MKWVHFNKNELKKIPHLKTIPKSNRKFLKTGKIKYRYL
jgi:hypothetical protein